VSRGEVRNAVLTVLADEPMHGYQVMQELEERSAGGWQPSPGSIYPTLQLLADEGLIVGEREGGKNVFALTTEGRAAVEEIDEPPAWERFGGDGMADAVKLRRSVHQLGMAAKQVVVAGSDQQIQAAQAIIADARKAIYKLLANDDEQ
jgi:DNA-binding PadR family transcriptional regulator